MKSFYVYNYYFLKTFENLEIYDLENNDFIKLINITT